MKCHYEGLLEAAEAALPGQLAAQCLERDSREYGGFPEPHKGFTEPITALRNACDMLALFWNADSRHHRSSILADRAQLALGFVMRMMHEDGTIDLIETNFHDATSFGFSVWEAGYTLRICRRFSKGTEAEADIEATLLEYLSRGADGIRYGGFHTPNHRWVMASALALLSNLLERPDLLPDLDLYTEEGIDCNPDGEYSERSAGVYNVVNNKGLLIMAEELGRQEYLAHVTRNLYMMMAYIEPDDTLLTLNSKRQDYGKEIYPVVYYENYLLAAHATGNPHFAWLADQLYRMGTSYAKDKGPLRRSLFPHTLFRYMLDDTLRNAEPAMEPYDLRHYEHHFKESGLVRFRQEDMTVTVLSGSDVFLKLQHQSNSVAVRMAASFFGDNGRFLPKELLRTEDGYRLTYRCDWGYVRPLGRPDQPVRDGRTNKEHREPVLMQVYEVTADIRLDAAGVTLDLTVGDCRNLPFKVEFLHAPGGYLETEQVQCHGSAGAHLLVKQGGYRYLREGAGIRVNGAFGETRYHEGLRGSVPQDPGAFTVYFTGWGPQTRTLRITAE